MNWEDRAACKGQTALMFSDDLDAALAVCDSCPVRRDCLADCMATEQPGRRWGVCGGLTAPERRRLMPWFRVDKSASCSYSIPQAFAETMSA